ncbi:MAG: hypothetical protein CR971_01720 [candidate division SR1 bacterium]|nr:MAG: hypothetical protein CR971_01720 [candidate division SR1 bacterium]
MFNIFKRKKEKILFISGGGFRGVYALGIMKRMEELNMKKDIKVIFGVSIGAVIGSARANGMSAQEIYDEMKNMHFTKFYALNIFKSGFKALISNGPIEKMIKNIVPNDIAESKIPVYLGSCDINTAKFIFFEKGPFIPLILASMAIPGLYPSVKYKKYALVDGGTVNPFPVDKAKEYYPNAKIIGINLNSFIPQKNDPKNIFEALTRSFNILMKSRAYEQNHLVDTLFFRELDVKLLEFNKKKLQTAFEQGYDDAKVTWG